MGNDFTAKTVLPYQVAAPADRSTFSNGRRSNDSGSSAKCEKRPSAIPGLAENSGPNEKTTAVHPTSNTGGNQILATRYLEGFSLLYRVLFALLKTIEKLNLPNVLGLLLYAAIRCTNSTRHGGGTAIELRLRVIDDLGLKFMGRRALNTRGSFLDLSS